MGLYVFTGALLIMAKTQQLWHIYSGITIQIAKAIESKAKMLIVTQVIKQMQRLKCDRHVGEVNSWISALTKVFSEGNQNMSDLDSEAKE